MSLIFEAKVLLFEALKASVPATVLCTFAETGDTARRQQVWLGATTDDDVQPVAFGDGTRQPTSVTGSVDVHAVVISPGNPVDAERSVNTLRDHITEACASIRPGAFRGLIDVRPVSASVDTSETTDGAYSALTVRVRIRGRVNQ